MRYGDLTFVEIREQAAAGALAIVPTGCTEQQGPHLPVDFDTWFAETIMLAAVDQISQQDDIEALVLPALPFGPTPEHRNFGSGYIDLPLDVHHAVIDAMLESLAAQGFSRIVVWRGCGGHQLQPVIDAFNARHIGQSRAFQPEMPYHASWCRVADPAIPSGHADSFTTALSLYLRPVSVRVDQISNPHNAPVDWSDPQLDFARYSATGVVGDPTHASAAIGERLWNDVLAATAQILRAIARTPIS